MSLNTFDSLRKRLIIHNYVLLLLGILCCIRIGFRKRLGYARVQKNTSCKAEIKDQSNLNEEKSSSNSSIHFQFLMQDSERNSEIKDQSNLNEKNSPFNSSIQVQPLIQDSEINSNIYETIDDYYDLQQTELKLLKRDRLRNESEVSRGNFGIVFKAELIYNKEIYWEFNPNPKIQTVAVKKFLPTSVCVTSMQTERKILEQVSKLYHPNLIKFCGAIESRDSTQIYLCTEFCAGGSLKDLLTKFEEHGENVSLDFQNDWARQICNGMRCLAAHKIIHCDLAARNILVSEDKKTLKITDFGLSKRNENENETEYLDFQTSRPLRWYAPECFPVFCLNGEKFQAKPVFTFKSDVWSYGVTLWEILTTGKFPFQNQDINDIMQKISFEEYRLKIPENSDPILANLIRKCWNFLPPILQNGKFCHRPQEGRPSFQQIWDEFFSTP